MGSKSTTIAARYPAPSTLTGDLTGVGVVIAIDALAMASARDHAVVLTSAGPQSY